jgi:hypothetical protein
MPLIAGNAGSDNDSQPAKQIKECILFSLWISEFELSATVAILFKGCLNSTSNCLTINYMALKIKSKESRRKMIDRLPAGIGLIWLGMILGISLFRANRRAHPPCTPLCRAGSLKGDCSGAIWLWESLDRTK